jgi:hypothetical protein
MALQGTLKDFSLADIFQLIGVQKKSGVLTLKHPKGTVTVSFLNGNVVAADSLPRKLEDKLGRVLVKSGVITEDQLNRALERQKLTLQRMGHVLVSEGFIQPEELQQALEIQVTQLIYRLFRWTDGQYHFNQEDHLDYDRENFQPINAETILMEGARILDEWPLIEKKLKSFSMVFRKTDPDLELTVEDDEGEDLENFDPFGGPKKTEAEPGETTVNRKEAVVYSLVDGKRTIHDLIERCRLSEFDTCKILYDLHGRRLIEESDDQPAHSEVRKERPVRRISLRPSPAVQKMARTVLLLAAGVFLATSSWNPFRLSRPLLAEARQTLDQYSMASSRARLERIQYTLQVYYLQKGRFPGSLGVLVQDRFLSDLDLKDPWGQNYQYEIFSGGYRLWGTDSSGNIPPHLNFEYRYPAMVPDFSEIALDP